MTNSDAHLDAPDVVTFPPIIFAIFFVIGYLTDLAFPTEIGAKDIRYLAGGAVIAAGVALAVWAISRMVRANTHIDVRKPATRLVTDGPYRVSRNPMYLAASLLYIGVTATIALPWTLTLLVPCLVTLNYGVIRREETYLEGKFDDDYRQYKSRVRRWI